MATVSFAARAPCLAFSRWALVRAAVRSWLGEKEEGLRRLDVSFQEVVHSV